MFKNISIKICNVIIIILTLICFACIITETVFNLLGLWICWNLFGYLIGLVVLPVCIILEMLVLFVLMVKFITDKKFGIVLEKKYLIVSPFVFWGLTIIGTVFAYKIIFTWGF